MANRQDFLLDSRGHFPLADNIINGFYLDTPYGDSDPQHIVDGIMYCKGWNKQFPTYGFGVSQYQSAEFSQSIFSNLKEELAKDGYIALQDSVQPKGRGFEINTAYIVRK